MKRIFTTTLLTLFVALSLAAQKTIYGFIARDGADRDVAMKQYEGKVVLVVNTATHCGFTPQYKELEALYEKYKDKGFVVLDFPCNQFGLQAPGSNKEIKQFCTENYSVSFPIFAKVLVNGKGETPLFTFLKRKLRFKGFNLNDERGQMMDKMLRKADPKYDRNSDIKWNFTKFLVDRKGKPVQRFEPTESMTDVEAALEKLL